MTLTTRIKSALSARVTTTTDTGTANASHVMSVEVDLTNGTGAGQADRVWSDTRTISASSSENLDLAGVLTDAFGTVVTFARVKAVKVTAAAANTNNVVVGAGSSPWLTFLNAAGTATLRPGGALLAVCGEADATGWVVTAGSGDILKVANSSSGTSVTYTITVIGASA